MMVSGQQPEGGPVWTEERVTRLLELANEGGKSASAIAEALNGEARDQRVVSRNSIIGKLHRMGIGLPGRNGASAERKAKEKVPPRRPVQSPVPTDPAPSMQDLFVLPVGPMPVTLPLNATNRAHLSSAAQAYVHFQQSVIDWIDAADETPCDADGNPEPYTVARPSAPPQTIPYWTGNDPKSLWDVGARECRFEGGRSRSTGAHFFCGQATDKGETFCGWHKKLCTT